MGADCGRCVVIESEQRATAIATEPNRRGLTLLASPAASSAAVALGRPVLADVGFLQEFGSLSGARIVRIATHPDLNR